MTNYGIPIQEMPVPDAEDLNLDAYCPLGMTFDSLIDSRQLLKQNIEDDKKQVEELDKMIAAVLDLSGQRKVVWNKEYLVFRREGAKPRPTLERVLLLEAGVTPEQIQYATRLGKPGKGGIAVRKLSDKNNEESAN